MSDDHYPQMLDQVDDETARSVLDMLEAAAEAGALPGFEGDPRGMGVIKKWRCRRFGEDGFELEMTIELPAGEVEER